MSLSVTLVQRLDSPAADALKHELLAVRGAPILLNAQSVSFCGALAMQLLVSARRQWVEDGESFSIVDPSKDLLEACRLLGVPKDEIGISEITGEPK